LSRFVSLLSGWKIGSFGWQPLAQPNESITPDGAREEHTRAKRPQENHNVAALVAGAII
jgi:hypothetical protein